MKIRIFSIAAALALVATLAAPLTAYAGGMTSGQTQVTGQLDAIYTLTVPSDFTFTSFTAAAGGSKSNLSLTASTVGGSESWVTINISDTTNNGYLKNGSTALSSALKLQVAGYPEVTLSNAAQSIVSTAPLTSGTWTTSNLTITQPPFNQVVAGSYSTTITFTAIFGN